MSVGSATSYQCSVTSNQPLEAACEDSCSRTPQRSVGSERLAITAVRTLARAATSGLRLCVSLACLAAFTLACGKQNRSPLPADLASRFDAQRAWRDLERVVSFGPRPSGSEALAHTAKYVLDQLRAASLQAEEQVFTTNTPRGPITFRNIIARTRPNCPPRFIVGGHYDTKWLPRMHFVGANDAGSSTAALLEIARVLAGQPMDAWIVWFDGEECMVKYDDKDGFYGSLHFVRQLFDRKMLRQIQAAIVLDMVGDKRLKLTIPDTDQRGAVLVQHVFAAAISLGLRDYVGLMGQSMLDDHMAFVMNGVPAIDLIDFDYGNIPGANNFWHTERDTLENCSPDSLRISGQITLELLRRLAFDKWPKE